MDELEEAGCGPIYTIDLGDGTFSGKFLSIRDYAKQVGEKVRQILEETGKGSVALVGHSMGGIVSSLYATEYAEPDTVSDVVTIGSPMHGTCWADCLAEGANGHEMMTESPLLEEVRHAIEETPSIRFYSVASKTDEIVSFASALHGNDPSKQMIVEDVGHISLMTSRKVARKVASWLKGH
jgi:poly(3-hydroxyalkanoate) synthetase